MKPVHWLGDSRKAVSDFPDEARRLAGWQLYFVQQGSDPADWKPMSTWRGNGLSCCARRCARGERWRRQA